MPERTITLADTVRLRSFSADRPDRVIALKPTTTGKLSLAGTRLVDDANVLSRDLADLHASGASARLRGERFAERVAGFLPKLESSAASVIAERRELQTTLNTIGALSYADHAVSASQVHLDLFRWQQIVSGPDKGQRHVAEVAASPALAWSDAEALIRLPLSITGIPRPVQDAVRIGLWEVQHREEHEALTARMAEVEFAQRAATETGAALVDAGVSMTEIIAAAPSVVSLSKDTPKLSWPDPRAALQG